jgi:DNA-directed RNA polymerase subunit RPC12/RpoP
VTYQCHNCGYDLSATSEPHLTSCPECGAVRAADVERFRAQRRRPTADGAVLNAATCSNCRHSLKGLRVERGAVTCPECGHTEIFALREIDAPTRIEIRERMRRGCLLALLAAMAFGVLALLLI